MLDNGECDCSDNSMSEETSDIMRSDLEVSW